jgi:hypothetical protein
MGVDVPREQVSAEDALHILFGAVDQCQYSLNRDASHRAAALAEAIGFARRNPQIYALAGDDDPVGTAARCAVLEASARFQLSENTVRNLASTADAAAAKLPLLWHQALEGFATLGQVDTALALLPRFDAAAVHELTAFDRALSTLAPHTASGGFRAQARRLADRLAPADPVVEHAQARAKRTAYTETVDAGMAWLHVLTDAADAQAAFRRMTSTAKHLQRRSRDGRTRDQIRSDLAIAWLKGVGTPTAVRTKVFVTVPADLLAPEARATLRPGLPAPAGAPDLNEAARLDTGEIIDRATAVRLLLEAGKFTRVITDPVTGVILDMDRRSRTATRQQREWLLLNHGTCTRDGCIHPAATSDIDHWDAYNGPNRGATDLRNLHPFCPAENQLKEKSRFCYRKRSDGTVELASPTGFTSSAPPRIGQREAQQLLARIRERATSLPNDPPF